MQSRGTPGVWRKGGPPCLWRPQPAHSCSATFCVSIPISSPSAMPTHFTPPPFLPHTCLQVIFNGQLTMSWGRHCKRKYFPVGATFSLGTRSWPRTHILSPARAPSVHRNGHFKQKMVTQNYKLVIKVMCTSIGAQEGHAGKCHWVKANRLEAWGCW